jgi:hypothetical protein
VKRSYAVVWSGDESAGSGRLDALEDRFELVGREHAFSIPFAAVTGAAIARRHGERLRGLPVLVLTLRSLGSIRIATLDGAGVLHELAQHVERAGLAVAA